MSIAGSDLYHSTRDRKRRLVSGIAKDGIAKGRTKDIVYSKARIGFIKPRLRIFGQLALATSTVVAANAKSPAAPDFGPNVLVFNPSTPPATIQEQIDKIYSVQQHSEFSTARYAMLFLPGEYHVDIPVGFYTQVLGLGATPDAVHITGNVHSDASLPHNNATCTFWRAAEGFSVTPAGGTMQWAVSQAVPFRRMHVQGNIVLHQNGGWASGGWMSDSVVDGNVGAGPQQQWISRKSNSDVGHLDRRKLEHGLCLVCHARLRASGPHPPIPRSIVPQSCARSRSSKSMRKGIGVYACLRCAPTAKASRGMPAQRLADRFL